MDTTVPKIFTSWLKKMKGGGMKGGADDSVTFGKVALQNVLATTRVTNHADPEKGFLIAIGTDVSEEARYRYDVTVCEQAEIIGDDINHLYIFLIIAVLSWHILALNVPAGDQAKSKYQVETEITAKIHLVIAEFCKLYAEGKKSRRDPV
jgi:hypothetical protein